MNIKVLTAMGLVSSMLVAMPVYAAPQTMADGGTFDAAYYTQNNPDVVAVYGTDANVLYQHYKSIGQTEGRLAYAGDPVATANLYSRIIDGTVSLPAGASLDVYQNAVNKAMAAAAGTQTADAAVNQAAETATTVQAPVSEFEQYIQQILAGIVTPDMTMDQQLRAAWDWLLGYASYKRTYETPSGDWTKSYAQELLTSGKGNCYRYAAAYAYLAKEIGADVKVVTGQINAARGGVTPHGWCVITVNGTEYICDPDMADAKNSPNAYYMKTFAQYPVKPLYAQNTWEINF